MDTLKVMKALANETRVQILHWLKEPAKNFNVFQSCFSEKTALNYDEMGVCVGMIQHKSGLSQSTISHYLSVLEDAGLVEARRSGQWTYYKRDETAIAAFLQELGKEL